MEATTAWGGSYDNATSKKKRKWWLVVLLVLLVAFVAAVVFAWFVLLSQESTGSRVIPAGDMTPNEAQAMLDEQAANSRITVSLAPALALNAEEGSARINFVVDSDNNGFAERFEVRQDDRILYKSERIEPGHKVEWVKMPGIHEGEAVVTVYAVNQEGFDFGNPVSVEVQIGPMK